MTALPVTLQINVAPSDHWHLGPSLKHHMRTWGPQVDEVVLSLETQRSLGRRGHEWEQGKAKVATVLQDMRVHHSHVRVVEVDYSDRGAAPVRDEFFGGRPIPPKDCFGAPFYAYLHGLHIASNAIVLHLDADILFGGGSQTWIQEAVATMAGRPDVLVCAPMAGPPTADGRILPRVAERDRNTQRYGSAPRLERAETLSLRYAHMSTRVFMIDRERFALALGRLKRMRLVRPGYPRALGHPLCFPLETVFSRAMSRQRLIRLNLLGAEPGMWYVHPPMREPLLERELERLIAAVEDGQVPPEQRGDDQMNASMFAGSQHASIMNGTFWARVRRRV